jgi:hypothetical protein
VGASDHSGAAAGALGTVAVIVPKKNLVSLSAPSSFSMEEMKDEVSAALLREAI